MHAHVNMCMCIYAYVLEGTQKKMVCLTWWHCLLWHTWHMNIATYAYVFICTYAYIHTYIYAYTCIHVHVHICIGVGRNTQKIGVSNLVKLSVLTHVMVYVYTDIYTCTYMYVCVYTYMYTYKYMYIYMIVSMYTCRTHWLMGSVTFSRKMLVHWIWNFKLDKPSLFSGHSNFNQSFHISGLNIRSDLQDDYAQCWYTHFGESLRWVAHDTICMYMHVCVHIYSYVHKYAYAYIHVWVYVYICMYIYVYVHAYIRTDLQEEHAEYWCIQLFGTVHLVALDTAREHIYRYSLFDSLPSFCERAPQLPAPPHLQFFFSQKIHTRLHVALLFSEKYICHCSEYTATSLFTQCPLSVKGHRTYRVVKTHRMP